MAFNPVERFKGLNVEANSVKSKKTAKLFMLNREVKRSRKRGPSSVALGEEVSYFFPVRGFSLMN